MTTEQASTTPADVPPQWHTPEEIAYLLHVNVRTVRMWIRRGRVQAVNGLLNLVTVLHWYDHHRDQRMDDVRAGAPTKIRVTSPPRQACPEDVTSARHTEPVEPRVTSLAHGTTASFTPPTDDQRQPQPWDRLLYEDGLPNGALGRIAWNCRYLQRLGIAPTNDMIDRMLSDERLQLTSGPKPIVTKPTIVYYLRVGDLIKIGQTSDLPSRLASYPPNAALLATEPGERDILEAERHAQFASTRAHRREWFHPSAALIEHINNLRDQPLTAADLAA